MKNMDSWIRVNWKERTNVKGKDGCFGGDWEHSGI